MMCQVFCVIYYIYIYIFRQHPIYIYIYIYLNRFIWHFILFYSWGIQPQLELMSSGPTCWLQRRALVCGAMMVLLDLLRRQEGFLHQGSLMWSHPGRKRPQPWRRCWIPKSTCLAPNWLIFVFFETELKVLHCFLTFWFGFEKGYH